VSWPEFEPITSRMRVQSVTAQPTRSAVLIAIRLKPVMNMEWEETGALGTAASSGPTASALDVTLAAMIIGRGKPKCSEKNLSPCRFVPHKSNTD
jgi:hypothetical protein